jgi:hypothetical protein
MLIALLPVPNRKQRNTSQAGNEAWKARESKIFLRVMSYILQNLTSDAARCNYYAICADGQARHCFPRLAAWIADYPEHCTLGGISYGCCQWCEVDKDSLGNIPTASQRLPNLRDHKVYENLIKDGSKEALAQLKERGVKPIPDNPLWQTGANIGDLPKPDLLHTMQLGILKHLLSWVEDFCKEHGQLDRFNDLWLQVPSYLDMTGPTREYGEVSQWQGKEIKQMARFLMSVLAGALDRPSPSQRRAFSNAQQCTKAILDFWKYCNYPLHDDDSLNQVDDALRRFHDHKDVFLRFRSPKSAKQMAKAARTNFIKERDEEVKHAKTTREKERLMDDWNRWIEAECHRIQGESSHFNFPKIHMLLHFRRQIERFGHLRQ